MNLSAPTSHRSPWSLDALSGRDLPALLDTAAALKHSHAPGPLRGKNIAMLSDSPSEPSLQAFTDAAQALGARVAQVRPAQWQAGQVSTTAAMLGRLYDAIACEGLAPELVADIRRDAGCPVFDGLAVDGQSLRMLADLLALREHSGRPLAELRLCFSGDACSAVGDAWLQTAALAGLDLCLASPRPPEPERLLRARLVAQATGARLRIVDTCTAGTEPIDYVCDEASPRRCADGRPEWACVDRQAAPLGTAQVMNQPYALQALLCRSLA